jgi:type VI secretion system ImpM family protein
MELSMSCRPVGRWLFGKLPSLGDFVVRGLDFPLRDSLDGWLSGEVQTARDAFGDAFEARYDSAPAWYFVDCDPQGQWSGGALCASIDLAGRRFPVMLAVPASGAADAASRARGSLDALYAAFAGGWDADRLQASEIVGAELPWHPDTPGWALVGEDGPARVLPGRFPNGVIQAMMELAA